MCMIFTDERERRWAMSQYIHSGLDANEQVSCFVDTMSPENLKKWMREMGATLPDEPDGRQYSYLQADKTYCPDGTFEVEPMIDTVCQAHYPSIRQRHVGARVTGEMSPRHRRDDLVEKRPWRTGEPCGVCVPPRRCGAPEEFPANLATRERS
jgi:MEDS: MEthanogen/methylotroph, DcmR Sensory domain